jgi:short-subunit dehydrogenase
MKKKNTIDHVEILMRSLGLGLMFAKALEANGAAKVYIISRNWEKLEAAAKQAVG